MNLAVCTAGGLFGGIEQSVLVFAREANRREGINLLVILFSTGRLHDKLKESGVRTELVLTGSRHDPRTIFRTAALLKLNGIEIVHTHGYKANIIGGIAARLCGAKAIKTEHGDIEPGGRCERWKMRMNLRLDRFVSALCMDRIVYVSEDVKRLKRGKGDGNVVYNGIDPIAPGTKHPLSGLRSSLNAGIVGRLTAVKGHRYVLKAFAELKELNLHLHVFGEGPLEKDLRALCGSSGLDGKVTFWGFRDDVHEYLGDLDVLLMPSLHEGFPYTLLEAAYLKVPFIASGVGGIKEVFEDGKDCVLVPPADVEALKSALEKLAGDPELRSELAGNAHEKVTSRFMIEQVILDYLQVYREVLTTR